MTIYSSSLLLIFTLLFAVGRGYLIRPFSEYVPNKGCAAEMALRGYTAVNEAFHTYTEGDRSGFVFPNMTFIGDSTVMSKVRWLEFLGKNSSALFLGLSYGCQLLKRTIDSVASMKRPGEVVIWNIGLHAMHLLPFRKSDLHSIAAYRADLRCIASVISEVYKGHQILYKLTNTVCHENYGGIFAELTKKWHDRSDFALQPEYAMQFTRIGSENINTAEREIAHEYNFTLLNTFTHSMCACSVDGRHYLPLVPHFMEKLLDTLHITYTNATAVGKYRVQQPQQP